MNIEDIDFNYFFVLEGRNYAPFPEHFASAGQRLFEWLVLLEHAEAYSQYDDVKTRLEELRRDVRQHFVSTARHIAESVVLSKALGESAFYDAHVLFYLLKPSQYRHIPTYLTWKYGKGA